MLGGKPAEARGGQAGMRTEAEILREGRRVLRRLASRRNALFAVAGGRLAVARSAAAAPASRVTLAADLAQAFLARDWIASDGPGRFVLAEAGRALLAGEESGFAARHRLMTTRTVADETGAPRALSVNAGESPLARLAFRNLVDPVQFAAGERLRRDFTLAQMTPRMGVDLGRVAVSGGKGGHEPVSDTALAAKQRFTRAMAAVGPELADLLFDVCCHLISLELAETRRSWNRRSGRVVLTIALDRLADHYGMRVKPRMHAPIRSWAMEEETA